MRLASSAVSASSSPSWPRSAPSRARSAAASSGPRRSSRSSIPSALTATRVWNCTRPSTAGITSCSRNSRTASRSSTAVGRSCITSPSLPVAGAVDELEEIPLHLGDPPAQGGELHRADRALEVGERLDLTDHAPLQRAHRLPVAELGRVDVPTAAGPVRREQVVHGSESAHAPVGHAEAPRLHTQPAQVLHWVAEVRELPVEHRSDAVRTDDEVAVAEVAVHERRPRRIGRRMLGKPAQAELERGVRLAEPVEVPAIERDLLARALHRERRQARRGEGGGGRCLLAAPPGEPPAGSPARLRPPGAAEGP